MHLLHFAFLSHNTHMCHWNNFFSILFFSIPWIPFIWMLLQHPLFKIHWRRHQPPPPPTVCKCSFASFIAFSKTKKKLFTLNFVFDKCHQSQLKKAFFKDTFFFHHFFFLFQFVTFKKRMFQKSKLFLNSLILYVKIQKY